MKKIALVSLFCCLYYQQIALASEFYEDPKNDGWPLTNQISEKSVEFKNFIETVIQLDQNRKFDNVEDNDSLDKYKEDKSKILNREFLNTLSSSETKGPLESILQYNSDILVKHLLEDGKPTSHEFRSIMVTLLTCLTKENTN